MRPGGLPARSPPRAGQRPGERLRIILVIWGTGALAINQIGLPNRADVFAYVLGALAAAVLIVAAAFEFMTSLHDDEPARRAYSAMHLPSVPITIVAD